MMTAVQYMCAKIGLVTGHGLAGVLKEHLVAATGRQECCAPASPCHDGPAAPHRAAVCRQERGADGRRRD
jgi:hypothetical protein